MEEFERLNPMNKWGWRKVKRVIKRRAKSLIPNVSYALGCRGHPGLVIEKSYWPNWGVRDLYGSDVIIKSLVDGIEESCSIFNCAPVTISWEEAERRLMEIQTMHDFDISVLYGYAVEEVQRWCQDWIDRGVLYYVVHDQSGYVVRSSQAFTREEAEEQVTRLKSDWIIEKGEITNPRSVDMLTYPRPITSFTVDLKSSS